MGCRHIHYPTILRRRGRFPVPLFSGAIALLGREATLLFNTIIFSSTIRSQRHQIITRGGLKGNFYMTFQLAVSLHPENYCSLLNSV